MPLHVLELIWWLDDHSMLDKDGTEFICLRKKAESAALTPPSLETIVRSQIDQLAPKIGEVLKCASIQGHTFDVELLQMTVGAELGLDKVSLEMMISNLANRQIIQGTGNANTWQVRLSLSKCFGVWFCKSMLRMMVMAMAMMMAMAMTVVVWW